MLIGIDCRTALQPKTGDRTYTLNLLRGLAGAPLPGWRFHLLLDRPDATGILPQAPHFETVVLAAPNSRLWTLEALPRHARRAGLDLVHVQYLAPPLLPCPFVTTIHDVVWRVLPRTFPLLHRTIMRHAMPGTARRARRIICGSLASRRDIARFLHVPPAKISVTPYAVEPRYGLPVPVAGMEAVRTQYGLGATPYVLSVGVLQPRKNVPRLITAFRQIKALHPGWPHRIVITGKPGWGRYQEAGGSRQEAGSDIVFTGYVEDAELPALYAGAELFAYPSLYEGFGYPILEAMACGCPVLTSNRSSMAEVAGTAAQLVDPRRVESIAHGLESVLGDAARRHELQQQGHGHAAQFTLARQAAATLEVYRGALAGEAPLPSGGAGGEPAA